MASNSFALASVSVQLPSFDVCPFQFSPVRETVNCFVHCVIMLTFHFLLMCASKKCEEVPKVFFFIFYSYV